MPRAAGRPAESGWAEGRGVGQRGARLRVHDVLRGRHSEEKNSDNFPETRTNTNSGDKSAPREVTATNRTLGPGPQAKVGEETGPREGQCDRDAEGLSPGRRPRLEGESAVQGWRAEPAGKEGRAGPRGRILEWTFWQEGSDPEGSGPCRQEGWGQGAQAGGGRGGRGPAAGRRPAVSTEARDPPAVGGMAVPLDCSGRGGPGGPGRELWASAGAAVLASPVERGRRGRLFEAK